MSEVKQKNSNGLFMMIIIILLIIIAILAFFVGKNYDVIFGNRDNTPTNNTTDNYEDLTIELIGDKRNPDMSLDQFEQSLAQQPSMRDVEFIQKDFSDAWVKEYLQKNDINVLPAIIFSTKKFDNSSDPQNLKVYLKELQDGKYSLDIGADYNPFSVNERGFLTLEGEIIGNSYIKGDKSAPISILEYTDLECPYCIQFHQTTYIDDLLAEYPEKLNYVIKHFPLSFHSKAKPGAELLECFGEQKGDEGFYELAEAVFDGGEPAKDVIIEKAVELGADETALETCYDEHRFASKVENDMAMGTEKFKVGGTPSVFFYNKETGEYTKASRNLEQDKQVIEKLLAE